MWFRVVVRVNGQDGLIEELERYSGFAATTPCLLFVTPLLLVASSFSKQLLNMFVCSHELVKCRPCGGQKEGARPAQRQGHQVQDTGQHALTRCTTLREGDVRAKGTTGSGRRRGALCPAKTSILWVHEHLCTPLGQPRVFSGSGSAHGWHTLNILQTLFLLCAIRGGWGEGGKRKSPG